MAAPDTSFTYIANIPSVVSFINTTITDKPTTYLWDFGDSSLNSVEDSPVHTYLAPGTYTVTLTATNEDGVVSYNREIAPDPYTTIPLEDFFLSELPPGLILSPDFKATTTKKWQLWLQVLVDPHIPTPDVHDDTKWPTLANNLIALLVIYDAYLKAAQGAVVLSISAASGDPNALSAGQEKKIETGPANAEWYDASNMVDALLKPGATREKSSIFDTLRLQICDLASRLIVKLPMCPPLPKPVIGASKVSKAKSTWAPVKKYPYSYGKD